MTARQIPATVASVVGASSAAALAVSYSLAATPAAGVVSSTTRRVTYTIAGGT